MNAACYAPVFELLLRMKGNYLWPAMWNSNFSLDGPGLENAVLADELGGGDEHLPTTNPVCRSGAGIQHGAGAGVPFTAMPGITLPTQKALPAFGATA